MAALLLTVALVSASEAQPIALRLPTANDALLRDQPADFYMYTDRDFEGQRSRPWQGGQYGFTRDQERTPAGVVFTRFHEGLDIQPLRRDRRGEPLDDVVAGADGRVAYVNTNPRASAYGIYVVVEHVWDGSPYYTLYGHLAAAGVRAGQRVARGDRLGRLGHTGTGINSRRAHVHFEVNLMLSERFEEWYDETYPRVRNTHGRFHGLNLAGLDPSALVLALRDNPDVTVGEVAAQTPPAWKVVVPGGFVPELVQRYPWLAGGVPLGEAPAAWIVHVAASGFPLRFEPAPRAVTRPAVVFVADAVREGYESTNKMLARDGDAFTLTPKGERYLTLLTLPAPSVGASTRTRW